MSPRVLEGMKLTVSPEAARLLKIVKSVVAAENMPAYLVGGFMRDSLLGRATGDIDITVAGALRVARRVADALGGKYFPLDEAGGTGRVVLPGTPWQLDFTTLEEGIEQDLARRDFTIDAMAVSLSAGKETDIITTDTVIDPFRGREDLERRLVRAVSDSAFAEDAARLLRAVRLTAELGFNIEEETERLIKRDSRLIAGIAGERVREELLRLLAVPGAGRRLAYLDTLGLLGALIPEMDAARETDQPHLHFWDVFEHSLQTVGSLEFVLREGSWEFAGGEILAGVPWSAELEEHFNREVSHGSNRRTLAKLAALLHDIAKPQTKSVEADGRTRFIGHPVEGATIAADIMERLRFSAREIKVVETLIKYHLRPTQMSNEGLPTGRAIYRFFRDAGETGIDLLFLSLADHLATRGPDLDRAEWNEHARLTDFVLKQHREGSAGAPLRPLMNGHDIMKLFGLEPGPRIGALLEALREARAAGEITTREQAREYTAGLLQGRREDITDKPR